MTVSLYDIVRAVESYIKTQIETPGNVLEGTKIKYVDKSVRGLAKTNSYIKVDVPNQRVPGGRKSGRLAMAMFQVAYCAKDNTKTTKGQLFLGSKFLTEVLDDAKFYIPGTTTLVRVNNVNVDYVQMDGWRSIIHTCECQFVTTTD